MYAFTDARKQSQNKPNQTQNKGSTVVGDANYSYDSKGNLTDINDGQYEYYYDCENRLIDVNENGSPVASYAYDYLGRRISKTVDGNTTEYCYDGDQVIAEYDGIGTPLRKFIYGPGIDEPIMMIDVANGNTVYYYHFDELSSVAAVSDSNTNIVERYSYNVFGAPTIKYQFPNHKTLVYSFLKLTLRSR